MIKVIWSEMNPPSDNIASNLYVRLLPCRILSSFSSGFIVFWADWFLLSFGFLFFFFFPSGLSTSIWALFSWTLSRLVSRNTTKRSNTENLKGTISVNLIDDIWLSHETYARYKQTFLINVNLKETRLYFWNMHTGYRNCNNSYYNSVRNNYIFKTKMIT